MDNNISESCDVMIIGGGIAGMQAALELADQDFKVLIIERDATIGGKMIRLDKVFPTLDCASCITTPKMASVAHHKNIKILTMCDLSNLQKDDDTFYATIIKRPRYVNSETCIGCRQCEYACPIMTPDEEQRGLSARKAIYIPFSNAIPQIALLDTESCILCGKCQKVCPTYAVDYFQVRESLIIESKSVIFATGYQLLEDYPMKAYGQPSQHPNVIDALQLERILAPTGPYMRMLRPSDGKEPKNVAFIKCAGSRDNTLGVGHCSRVCCMYSIKNALLIQQELPSTDVSVFYIDTRAFGKNYEQFFRKAQQSGVNFIKAKPIILDEGHDQSIVLRYEDQENGGKIYTKEFDLVVLCLAIISALSPEGIVDLPASDDGFLKSARPKISSTMTDMEGVFMAGIASGPKDIVDSIIEAGAAAMEAANYIMSIEHSRAKAA